MKKTLYVAAFLGLATQAQAGALSDPVVSAPVMAPKIIEDDAQQNSSIGPQTIIALLALVTIGTALSN